MKTITVVLTRDAPAPKEVVSALKVFRKKNRAECCLRLFGSAKALNIFRGNPDFEVHVQERGEDGPSPYRAATDGALIVLGSREEVIANASAVLVPLPEKRPVLGLLLPSKIYHHNVFFLDLGAKKTAEDDLDNDLAAGKDFLARVLLLKEARYGLLYPTSPTPDSLSGRFVSSHQGDSLFQGVIRPRELLEGKCDLVLGESFLVLSAIEGAKGSVSSFHHFLEEEIAKSAFFRAGSFLLQDVRKSFEARFDWSFSGNGLYLLNYPLPILILEERPTYSGFLQALSFSLRALRK